MTTAPVPLPEGEAQSRRRPGLLVLLPVIVFGGLAILFAFRLAAGDPSRLPSVLTGRSAPSFVLPGLDGLKTRGGQPVPGVSNADLKRGDVSVVNVWASWCAPCRLEHPLLMDLAAVPGARLVGLNYKDKPDAARRFLGALGNPFAAVGVDESGRTGIDWGVYGVPETFVVGRDGTIRFKQTGPLTAETLPALLAAIQDASRP